MINNNKSVSTGVKKTSDVENAKGVSGTGINQSQDLPYDMVLLLKRFLITVKKGEQVVELQR